MISFWQTDPRLHPDINLFGCAFLSAHYLLPDDLSPSDINARWDSFKLQKIIDDNDDITSWAGLLGGVWSAETVERFPLSFAHTAMLDYECGEGEKEIIKWYLSNVKENHFTVGDGKGATLWDSMNRPDIMKAYATFVSKVIVKVG